MCILRAFRSAAGPCLWGCCLAPETLPSRCNSRLGQHRCNKNEKMKQGGMYWHCREHILGQCKHWQHSKLYIGQEWCHQKAACAGNPQWGHQLQGDNSQVAERVWWKDSFGCWVFFIETVGKEEEGWAAGQRFTARRSHKELITRYSPPIQNLSLSSTCMYSKSWLRMGRFWGVVSPHLPGEIFRAIFPRSQSILVDLSLVFRKLLVDFSLVFSQF